MLNTKNKAGSMEKIEKNKFHKRRKRSQWREIWARLRRNKIAMVALVIIFLLIFVAVFAEALSPYAYDKQNLSERFESPSLTHPFGTDNLGRDLLSRIFVGARVSLLVALAAIAISTVIGILLGATAAYYGGWYEVILLKIMDILMAIPPFLLAVSISAALGAGTFNTSLALAVGAIPSFFRMIRGEVIGVKGKEFVEAAKASGASVRRIIWKHIVPNALSSTIVNVTIGMGASILAISGLSFIGLGVQPPTPEWGSILATGRAYIRDFWPMVTFPGLAIMITMIGFNLLGDGLRDAMDPKLKR